MRRWGQNIASVLSLIIAVVCVFFWRDSTRVSRSFHYLTPAGNAFGIAIEPGAESFFYASNFRNSKLLEPPFKPLANGWSTTSIEYGRAFAVPPHPMQILFPPIPRIVTTQVSRDAQVKSEDAQLSTVIVHSTVVRSARDSLRMPRAGSTEFDAAVNMMSVSTTRVVTHHVDIPFWMLSLLALVMPILRGRLILRRRRRFRRSRAGQCVACGYALTGNTSGNCPECGTTIVRNAAEE